MTAGEEGMISLVSLFAVLGLLVMFGALANVGRITTRKLETQNAADAVAHGAGVEMARGLNSVTTGNHLIGELTALCIIHHGFGGDELDKGQYREDVLSKLALLRGFFDSLLGFATPIKPEREAFNRAFNDKLTGGAIRDSRIQLRYVLANAFSMHGGGAVLYFIPWTRAIGLVVMGVAKGIELKVLQEWRTLDFLEAAAKATVPVKKALMSTAIPALHKYTELTVLATPLQMELAADQVGARNGATGRLFPGLTNASHPLLKMPLEKEPARPRSWQKSQLVRATTPWVQYWRKPWLDFGMWVLSLSGFAVHYDKRTDEYTKTLTDRLRGGGVRLYILPGWQPGGTEKGREDWTRGTDQASRRIDELFCTLGLAHRDPPGVVSYGIYRKTNPDGMVGYAQALVYGANPQVPAPGSRYQPRLGWDTLHWTSAVREFPGESVRSFGAWPIKVAFSVPDVDEPLITINWQTKLVPTTRLQESLPYQKGQLGTVLRRISPRDMTLNRTH